MNEERPQTVRALFEESMEWVRTGRTRKALSSLFMLFRLDPCHQEALRATSKIMHLLKDIEGAERFMDLAGDPGDPDRLYRAGFHLINMGRPETARSFLETCLLHTGHHPDVLYELGYCNFLDHKYDRAAEMLKRASKDLDPERAADGELLILECLLYSGRHEEGRGLLDRLGGDLRTWGRSDAVDALELMYARHKRILETRPLDLRTWHYIQHGGILLAQSDRGKAGGRFESLDMNAMAVGALLRLLQAVVEGLEIRLEAVLAPEEEPGPLALAAGSLLQRPVRSWSRRSGNDEMLVVPDMHALERAGIQPMKRDDCAYLFCFRVFPMQQYPLLPELIGLLAGRFRFPWEERVILAHDRERGTEAHDLPTDARESETIAREIADGARILPEDQKAKKLVDFYRKNRSLLVAADQDRFHLRRMYHPHSPA